MRIAYLVLLITLATTTLVFLRLRETNRAHDQLRFERLVTRAQTGIDRRILRCVDQMYNMRALLTAATAITSQEWDTYIAAMNFRQEDFGIRSLGYLERVPEAGKDEFLKRQRAIINASFAIDPEGDRPVYYPVVYITIFGPVGVVKVNEGLDHGVHPQRLEIIERAIDENNPFATEKVDFLAPEGTHTNTGIVLYLPVYRKGSEIKTVEQRRQAAQGLIYAAIKPATAFAGLLGSAADQADFEIYDGGKAEPDALLYEEHNAPAAGHPKVITQPYLARETSATVLNRQWTIQMSTLPPFEGGLESSLQWLALSVGLIVSVLLFGITWVQVNARLRAEHDSRELQRSEAALAAEKELLDVTVNSIADGVITTDIAGKIISINKTVEILIGWPRREAEGKILNEVFRIIRDDTQEPCINPVEKALFTRTTVEMDNHVLLIARDETRRAIAVSAAPIRDNRGDVVGAVLVLRDVTEKQKAEAQMLTESKLQSVGLLAGGIAHDFNNMLTTIIGNLSLARMPEFSAEETPQLLAEAEKAALGAKDLTQQLLTFARGGAPIRKPMLLPALVREASQLALRGSNVQCEYSLADNAWPVEVDEGQIRQILNNLVINARQAMPQGGRIEIRTENVELSAHAMPSLAPGKYVKISIHDHGPGIKPEHLPRIFEPYFTTKKAGTGLGLATVYSVVRKHDGQINVVSEPGKGTTFEIYLPASQKAASPVPPPATPANHSGHGRVLVVDDETAIQKLLEFMLRKFGYEVEIAGDGGEAIDRYLAARSGGTPFDAIIMDLTIPNGMGGCEATRRLRELDPQVRAIASSGYSLDPVMANYRDYGFCGVIPKPYRAEELNRILHEVIGNGRASN